MLFRTHSVLDRIEKKIERPGVEGSLLSPEIAGIVDEMMDALDESLSEAKRIVWRLETWTTD